MTEEQIKKFYTLCDSLDIRKFSSVELGMYFMGLKQEILIGLKRNGPRVEDDGGLEAIDSTVKPVTGEQADKIPVDSMVIYGAYAGTNWITGLATKIGKNVIEQHLVTKSFLDKSTRSFSSREEFAAMLGGQIKEAIETLNTSINKINTLAISFGFPFKSEVTNYGRDAVLQIEHLTKSWYIRGASGMYLGKYVLEYLHKIGIDYIKKVYFANDTTAVSLDVSAKYSSVQAENMVSLPIGFVMGTGDNGSAVFEGYKNNNLINLEIGSATAVKADQVMERMIKEKTVPTKKAIIEYYMGGDYLLARLATSMFLLQENGAVKNDYYNALLKYALGAKITSKLAAREVPAEDLSELFKFRVKADELFMLNEVAKRTIAKGGQAAGLMVAAVCDVAGWVDGLKGAIPVEGTVFSQGFGFRESVRKTMKLLVPKHKLIFVPGSGTRGISTEAMIKSKK